MSATKMAINKKTMKTFAVDMVYNIIGSLLYNVCAQVSFLQWLTIGESISFSPAADLSILKFSLQMEFRLTLAQVVGVLVGLFCYHHFH